MAEDFELEDEFKPYFEDPQLTPEQIEQIRQRPVIKVPQSSEIVYCACGKSVPAEHVARARRVVAIANEDRARVKEALDEMSRPMAVCIECNRDVIIEEMYDEITCIECHG